MPTTIADGRGTGSLARVTDNRLQVESNQRPFISFKAKGDEKAFAITGTATSGLSAGNFIFAVQYTGTSGGFVISHIDIGTNQTAFFRFHKTTGTGAGTSLTPRQLNFGSAKPAQLSAWGSGQVTGLTSAYHYSENVVLANSLWSDDTDDTPIVVPNTQFAIELENIPGSAPTRVAINVYGYESDLEV